MRLFPTPPLGRYAVPTEKIAQVLKLDGSLRALCEQRLTKERSLLILGRGYQHATCKEGALVRARAPRATDRWAATADEDAGCRPLVFVPVPQKIKEMAYLHTEGIQAGELKHGPLALIDETMPVILIMPMDNVHEVRRCVSPAPWADRGRLTRASRLPTP